MGVAAATGSRAEILTAAVARWAAGAMSMAAGEYVSVSSQADSEAADLARERRALREQPSAETARACPHLRRAGPETNARASRSPINSWPRTRLTPTRATSSASARTRQPKPIQAAFASALAFSLGAALPTLAAFLAPAAAIVKAVPAAAMVFLVALGALGAWAGGAPMVKPALRVGFWGALAMAVTAGIGALIGKAV